MAPIQLKDEQPTSGCLSSIFSRFSGNQAQPESSNEKYVYSAVDPMEQLPPYEDIVEVITLLKRRERRCHLTEWFF